VGITSILLQAREYRENDVLSWFTDSYLRSEGLRIESTISYSKFPTSSVSILDLLGTG
jgi:hypothetical protein